MLGRFLFRWRGVIGFVAFGVVFWLARPTFGSCLLGIPFLLAGLGTRFWASGYIGIEGRTREIGVSRRLVSGPYRLLRHPLYIGNFLLVAGMLVALWPPLWLGAVVLVGFLVEYAVIVAAEEAYLTGLGRNAKRRVQSADCKMADGGQPDRRSEKLEPGTQDAGIQMAISGWREARGEQFLVARALCEWRTWVVTGAAWGLATLRAAVRS